MKRCEATERILAAKHEKKLSFGSIAKAVGRHPVWVTSALLGQATMSKEEAHKAVEALGIGDHLDLGDLPARDREGEGDARPSARRPHQPDRPTEERRLRDPGTARERLGDRRCPAKWMFWRKRMPIFWRKRAAQPVVQRMATIFPAWSPPRRPPGWPWPGS